MLCLPFMLSCNCCYASWAEFGAGTDPLQYATRALLVNEFTGPHWNKPDINNPGQYLGRTLLNQYGFPPDYW